MRGSTLPCRLPWRHVAWMLAVCFCGLCASTALATAMSRDVAQSLRHTPAAQRALDRVRRAIDAGNQQAAVDTLVELAADHTAVSEATLHASLVLLADAVPGGNLRAAVERLAQRTPRLFVQHDETTTAYLVPIYDSGAAARYALRRWRAARAASDLSVALRRGELPEAGASRGATKAGIAAALDGASNAQLLRSRDALAAALAADPGLAPAALRSAIVLRDAGLMTSVVQFGDDRDALDAVAASATLVDPAAATRVIDAGLAREATASRAVFALAERARSEPRARARLLALPGSPRHGESAAAALAGLDDPALTRTLSEQLFAARDERRATHLALALRLSASEEAHRALARYAATPGPYPQLRSRLRGTSL